ncbi:MAG TPA: hypothetical protein ENH14_01590, partial [candidate division WOR-3 bacterium]|nr:hypothetical protein [candidate division WOR-3 bacterium]
MKKLSIIIFILLLTINARSQSPMTVGTFPGDVLGLGLNESSNYSPTGIWDFSGADYTSFGDSVNVDGMIVYSSDNDVYIKFSSNRIQFNTRDGVKLDLQGYGVALGGNFLDLSS